MAHEIGHLIGLHHSSNWVEGITQRPLMAPSPAGSAITLQSDDDKFAGNARYGQWEQLPGAAVDIAVSIYGHVWIIGTNGRPWRWNSATGAWVEYNVGVSCKRIDVDASGDPWVVANDGRAFRYRFGAWGEVPGGGRLLDIGWCDPRWRHRQRHRLRRHVRANPLGMESE